MSSAPDLALNQQGIVVRARRVQGRGDRILELSTKCAPTQMFQVAAETRAFFAQHLRNG